jgi:hypothetical protein
MAAEAFQDNVWAKGNNAGVSECRENGRLHERTTSNFSGRVKELDFIEVFASGLHHFIHSYTVIVLIGLEKNNIEWL